MSGRGKVGQQICMLNLNLLDFIVPEIWTFIWTEERVRMRTRNLIIFMEYRLIFGNKMRKGLQ